MPKAEEYKKDILKQTDAVLDLHDLCLHVFEQMSKYYTAATEPDEKDTYEQRQHQHILMKHLAFWHELKGMLNFSSPWLDQLGPMETRMKTLSCLLKLHWTIIAAGGVIGIPKSKKDPTRGALLEVEHADDEYFEMVDSRFAENQMIIRAELLLKNNGHVAQMRAKPLLKQVASVRSRAREKLSILEGHGKEYMDEFRDICSSFVSHGSEGSNTPRASQTGSIGSMDQAFTA